MQINRVISGLQADSVTVDNRNAAYRCVRMLIEAGHTRIGLIAELESSKYGGVEAFIRASAKTTLDPQTLYPS